MRHYSHVLQLKIWSTGAHVTTGSWALSVKSQRGGHQTQERIFHRIESSIFVAFWGVYFRTVDLSFLKQNTELWVIPVSAAEWYRGPRRDRTTTRSWDLQTPCHCFLLCFHHLNWKGISISNCIFPLTFNVLFSHLNQIIFPVFRLTKILQDCETCSPHYTKTHTAIPAPTTDTRLYLIFLRRGKLSHIQIRGWLI